MRPQPIVAAFIAAHLLDLGHLVEARAFTVAAFIKGARRTYPGFFPRPVEFPNHEAGDRALAAYGLTFLTAMDVPNDRIDLLPPDRAAALTIALPGEGAVAVDLLVQFAREDSKALAGNPSVLTLGAWLTDVTRLARHHAPLDALTAGLVLTLDELAGYAANPTALDPAAVRTLAALT